MFDRTKLLERARAILRSYKIPRGTKIGHLPLTHAVLERSFYYFIDVDETSIDVAKLAPGDSRFVGRPHLPGDLEWPSSTYFYAQLDMAAIKPFDVPNILPSHGTLYLFYDPFATTARACFFDGALDKVPLRKAPLKKDLPRGGEHYYADHAKRCYEVSFHPAFSFQIDGMPAKLIDRLSRELDIRHVPEPVGTTIFGEPLRWYGEELGEGNRVLLLQREFVDAQLHFWVEPKRLAKRDFSKIKLTGSVA